MPRIPLGSWARNTQRLTPKLVAEYGKAALGRLARGLVLNHIPVLHENPIVHSKYVRHNPVHGHSEVRKSPVQDDKENTEGKGTEGQAVGEVQQMRAVAIRKGQSREKVASYLEMGTLRCEGCGEEFFIGHHPAFVDKRLADKQAHWLERVLAEEHERDNRHSDQIELPD
jgi:hypothetical protein